MKLKNNFIYLLVCSALIGCSNESLSDYTGGVSLGGTGLPTTTGGGDISPLPSEGEINTDDNYKEYLIWSVGEKKYYCNDLEVSIQLSHNNTGELIEAENGIIVQPTEQNMPTNVALEVNVKNLGSNVIYEYLENCQLPFELINESQELLRSNQISQCLSGEAIQIYSPLETKTYRYKFSLPLENQKWLFKYLPLYSINEFAPTSKRNTCETYYPMDVVS